MAHTLTGGHAGTCSLHACAQLHGTLAPPEMATCGVKAVHARERSLQAGLQLYNTTDQHQYQGPVSQQLGICTLAVSLVKDAMQRTMPMAMHPEKSLF